MWYVTVFVFSDLFSLHHFLMRLQWTKFLFMAEQYSIVCVCIHTHYIHIHISFMYSSISGYLVSTASVTGRWHPPRPASSKLLNVPGELEGRCSILLLGACRPLKGSTYWSGLGYKEIASACTHLHTHTDIKLELKTYQVLSVLGLRGRKVLEQVYRFRRIHKPGEVKQLVRRAPTCLGRTTTFASLPLASHTPGTWSHRPLPGHGWEH